MNPLSCLIISRITAHFFEYIYTITPLFFQNGPTESERLRKLHFRRKIQYKNDEVVSRGEASLCHPIPDTRVLYCPVLLYNIKYRGSRIKWPTRSGNLGIFLDTTFVSSLSIVSLQSCDQSVWKQK